MSQNRSEIHRKGNSPNPTPAQQMAAFRMQIDKIKPELLQHVLGPHSCGRLHRRCVGGGAWRPALLIADRLSFFAALRKCAHMACAGRSRSGAQRLQHQGAEDRQAGSKSRVCPDGSAGW